MVGEVEEWVVEAMWKDGEGGEREEEVDGEEKRRIVEGWGEHHLMPPFSHPLLLKLEMDLCTLHLIRTIVISYIIRNGYKDVQNQSNSLHQRKNVLLRTIIISCSPYQDT